MGSQRATSIVDISEIEDDDGPGRGAAPALAGPRPAHSPAQLYLYHEDLEPQQRISSVLSSMINLEAPCPEPRSADTSPGQTLARPDGRQEGAGAQLAAIEYAPPGRVSPGARSPPPVDPPAPATPAPAAKANLGTLTGVYFPCVQNIFGVILFIRMVWIVGTAGVPAAFSIVFICCCVTLTTSISLSAIATNGIVPAGGSYFMISRSLGPECGGAVGTMFFLGTTVAGAMYITGAVEIMLNYLAPSWGLFGDFQRDVAIMYHNIRVYGTLLLIIVGLMVWIGVRFVSKLAPVALFCVLFSIFSIYAGIFINYNGRPDLMICVVGDRLVTLKNMPFEEAPVANSSGKPDEQRQFEMRRTRTLCTYDKLRQVFCPSHLGPPLAAGGGEPAGWQEAGATQRPDEKQSLEELFRRPANMSNCDPYFRQNRDRIRLERAVPGIASGVLFDNLKARFRNKGALVSYDEGQGAEPGRGYNWVFVDISTSFTALIAIYFPSCTGILAGSNRSGDLADAQRSIPRGTIAAQLTTSCVYLSCIVLFGSTFNNLFIRDKFGESMGGQLAVTQIAWPEPSFILLGGLLSTLGAALQSLVGAPRILQGIAKDDVMPCFRRFARLSARGEPEAAILATLAISELAVLIGNLDFIAPILTLSLVMCYFFINLACTLHSLLGSPNWRPRFRHYHWSISTLGCLLCLFVMVVSSWLYFGVAIFLASCIYKYIEFSGAEKEWGDGKQGLALSAATYNLLRLRTSEPHTKNWRPQLLLFVKLRPSTELEPAFVQAQRAREPAPAGLLPAGASDPLALAHPKLLTFASQLKAGKGLTLVSAVLEGDYKQLAGAAQRARATLQECVQRERVRGFADVLVASSILDGLSYQVQTAGLGGLKHNTVILGWPANWRKPVLPTRPEAAHGHAHNKRASLRQHAGQQQPAGQAHEHQAAARTRAHLFIELMRSVQVSQNALLVVKGVDSWPESCDKLGGFIDIWWIVNDGGLLMLLPHLLKQHRTWKSCQLRIFTVAQSSENTDQMRQDLNKFLYHLRIEAQVDIVEMKDTEISDYAYERTLMMEQRGELIKRLSVNRRQSLLLEQEVDGRLIRFRIRKPSACDFEEPAALAGAPEQLPMGELPAAGQAALQAAGAQAEPGAQANGQAPLLGNLRPDEANVRRMHTALSLNEAILRRSKAAKLVIINLPGAPKESTPEAENNYMEFIEIITDKLERVLLVQNGGREVITIHS